MRGYPAAHGGLHHQPGQGLPPAVAHGGGRADRGFHAPDERPQPRARQAGHAAQHGGPHPADRAGAVALGSIEKVVEVQLRLAGGPREITQNVNVEEFVKQADYYDTLQNNTWDKLLQNYAILGASHPFTAIRVREILKWGKTEQCQRILKNIKLEQDGLICPNCGKPLEKDWIYCKHCGFKLK